MLTGFAGYSGNRGVRGGEGRGNVSGGCRRLTRVMEYQGGEGDERFVCEKGEGFRDVSS